MSLTLELTERAEVLTNAKYQDVTGRLTHLLEWMDSQAPIREIMNSLRITGMGAKLISEASYQSPPKAHTMDEIAGVGLALIEACRGPGMALFQAASKVGIRAAGSNSVDDHSNEALHRYILPFLNYVLKRLPPETVKPTSASSAVTDAPPIEISHSLARFRTDHPDPAKIGFLVMRFDDTPAHQFIQNAINDTLGSHGLKAVRADGKRYHDDILYNVLTYLHGCSFGVAIFERITRDDFNPNVSLEVGYLMAMRKPILLLKDQNLKALQTDLVGRIYAPFDFQNPLGSIPPIFDRWLRDKGIIV